MHKPNGTQQERILAILRNLAEDKLVVPEEFIRKHPTGDGISARYFKQAMFISECNGRISELRTKGHEIETSKAKDEYGFVYHRLRPATLSFKASQPAPDLESWFDRLPAQLDTR
jgi:hypothetical protein